MEEIRKKMAYLTEQLKLELTEQNRESILRTFRELFPIFQQARDFPPENLETLNDIAGLLISCELESVLTRLQLESFQFYFVALNLLKIEDVIKNLSNVEIARHLIHNLPPLSLKKLERELLPSSTSTGFGQGATSFSSSSSGGARPKTLKSQRRPPLESVMQEAVVSSTPRRSSGIGGPVASFETHLQHQQQQQPPNQNAVSSQRPSAHQSPYRNQYRFNPTPWGCNNCHAINKADVTKCFKCFSAKSRAAPVTSTNFRETFIVPSKMDIGGHLFPAFHSPAPFSWSEGLKDQTEKSIFGPTADGTVSSASKCEKLKTNITDEGYEEPESSDPSFELYPNKSVESQPVWMGAVPKTSSAVPAVSQTAHAANQGLNEECKDLKATIKFEKRCKFFQGASTYERWVKLGTGIIKIIYDDEISCCRIIFRDDNERTHCDHVIAMETELEVDGTECSWSAPSAIDFLDEVSYQRTSLRSKFTCEEESLEFKSIFALAKQISEHNDIHEDSGLHDYYFDD